MDAVSYSHSAKQAQRIEKFIENPDSTSGVLTQPSVIHTGEAITVPAGRTAILANTQIDGTLTVDGTVFIPSGATLDGVVEKVTSTDNAIVRFNGATGKVQNSAITLDDNGNIGSGTQSFNGFGGSGFKNYIINGNFDVWQYATSQTSSGYGSDDRWNNTNVGTTKTHSRVACTDTEKALFNASYFSRTVAATAGTSVSLVLKKQHIEDVTRLAGKTVTLSFWAKADSNKNIAMEVVQGFGTGGSPSAVLDKQNVTTIGLTPTWQKKTITFTIPSIAGKTIGTDGVHTSYTQIRLWFDAGTDFKLNTNSLGSQSGTFDIAQVQLEEGSVATPFEQRPIGLELSLCQRYYEIIDGERILCSNGSVSSWLGATVTSYWKSTKRVSPTVTLTNWSGTMTAVPTASAFGLSAVVTTPSVQAATNQYGQFSLTGSAEL